MTGVMDPKIPCTAEVCLAFFFYSFLGFIDLEVAISIPHTTFIAGSNQSKLFGEKKIENA